MAGMPANATISRLRRNADNDGMTISPLRSYALLATPRTRQRTDRSLAQVCEIRGSRAIHNFGHARVCDQDDNSSRVECCRLDPLR